MALPRGKQESNNTPPIEEPGNYEDRLKALNLTTAKEFGTETEFNNGDGLRFQAIELTWDIDGIDLTEKFVRVSTNEKAKLFNRISALLGRDLNDKDELDWGVNANAETNHPLDQYYKASKDDPENNIKKDDYVLTEDNPKYEGIEGALDYLKVNGEDLIGKSCLVNVVINKNNYNRVKETTPLPKTSRAKPKPVKTDDSASAGMPT